MTDPMDVPAAETHSLVYPFIACASQGGPYDDDPFVAGVQLGRADVALETAALLGADRITFTVRTTLVRQLELAGMARGFSVMVAAEVAETEDHPAMPEWSHVTFTQAREMS